MASPNQLDSESTSLHSEHSLMASEEILKARAHFRSSGYATGSEDSVQDAKSSKSSMQLSQESSSDDVFVDSQILISSQEAPKCVENDFTPKNGKSTSAAQNDIPKVSPNHQKSSKMTASPPARGAEGRIVSDQLPSDINTYGPKAWIEPAIKGMNQCADYLQPSNISSTLVVGQSEVSQQNSDHHKINGVSKTMAQTPQTASSMDKISIDSTNSTSLQVSQQSHLSVSGSMNLSSSSNRDTSLLAQNARTKPPFIRQKVLKRHPESFECSGESLNAANDDLENGGQISKKTLDQPLSSASYYLPEDPSVLSSSIGCQYDKVLLEVLEKCARCTDTICQDPDCVQMRKDMTALQDFRKDVSTLNEPHLRLLNTMIYHAFYNCHHPKCPLYWCGDVKDKSPQDGLQIMKQRLENFAEYCRLSNSPVIDYMKLNETLYDSMPLEGQAWVRLCTLGTSRKTLLAFHFNSDLCSNQNYWVIKKVSTAGNLHQWNLYSRLRDVSHRSVASVLWAANCKDYLLVCYPFQNLTLQDCLPALPSQQLELISIYKIMQQLMSATEYLNDLGVAYLYWTSKNILYEYRTEMEVYVKICNFTCSTLLDDYDGEWLFMTLPPSLLTPELRENCTVKLVSDVWGVGCLLHELVTGVPVWYEHRHMPDSDLKALMGKSPIPKIPNIYPELQPVFQACWETDWEKRKSVTELQAVLSEAYQGSFKKIKTEQP